MTDDPTLLQPGEVGPDRLEIRVDGLDDLPSGVRPAVVCAETPDDALVRRGIAEGIRALEALDVDGHVMGDSVRL